MNELHWGRGANGGMEVSYLMARKGKKKRKFKTMKGEI
jgi:hypothetical protein